MYFLHMDAWLFGEIIWMDEMFLVKLFSKPRFGGALS